MTSDSSFNAEKRQFHRLIRELPDLESFVFDCVRQIPSGKVTTYGDIAQFMGSKAASRWVGQILLNHVHDVSCKCHRVVRAGGDVGLFVTDSDKKDLLAQDGIMFRNGRVDLERHSFSDFAGERPLVQLARIQQQVIGQFQDLCWSDKQITTTAGVDVSYKGQLGFAAYVLYDLKSKSVEWTNVVSEEITFPYIPSFLSFRELPLLLNAIDAARDQGRMADLILVDGSGILHPRRAGIATMLGILVDVPTVGVTKKHLAGKLDQIPTSNRTQQAVSIDDEILGYAFLPRNTTKKPLYVSPGNGIDPESAFRFVQSCMLGRALPEPIYWADKLSRAESKKSTS